MKITNIYKTKAALIFLMVAALWPAAEACGQEYGDRYETVGGDQWQEMTGVTIESSSSVTNSNNIFSGSSNSYATIQVGGSGTIVLNVGQNSSVKRISFSFTRSGNRYYRPSSITVSTSDNSNIGFVEIGSASNISNTTTLTIDFNQSARQYIRLEINAQNQRETHIYNTKLYVEPTSDLPSIQHKPAKWYTMRKGGNFVDTFDDEHPMFENAGINIQSAHTYVDTLYVKKGSSVSLWLPTISSSRGQSSAQKYQRWYNYLTEGTFATGLTGDNNVNDILTPKSEKVYRFQNGYVGGASLIGNSSITYGANFYYPEDDEYKGVSNSDAGNDYYVVGCDISGYTDFTKDFISGQGGSFSDSYMEPTLSLRVLYYIVGIDDDAWGNNTYLNQYERLNTDDYKNGGNKYLEEYEITFPCDHVSDHTDEMVAIARNAEFYRVPGDWNGTLSVEIDENSAGIQLVNDELTDNRIISFRKTGVGANTPWSVSDGTTATILVKKTVSETTYNIARFKLTFKKNTRLLTQHQIDRLDKHRVGTATIQGEDWFQDAYLYRTPEYLEENYIELTSRTFDYDPEVADDYGQSKYYPYPLSWDYSSYAFFDGSTTVDFDGSTDNNSSFNKQPFTEWGSYAIVNDYMGYGDKVNNTVKAPTDPSLGGRNGEGYFLYVDASDRPGELVSLPFTENLCPGSELLVSAWVKSAEAAGNDDAAMLFTIYGIDEKGNRTPIYRQSSSQIKTTTKLTTESGSEYTNENGYGSSQNDWYQVFMSFVNDDWNVSSYQSYELRVDNNCASTGGGDYYLDEIRVYIAKPLAEARQLRSACTTERTLMSLRLDWDRFMARVGNEGVDETRNLGICFIDTLLFHNNFNGNNFKEAMEKSAVHLGQEDNSYEFRVLTYNSDFEEKKAYDLNNVGGNLAATNGDAFYGFTSNDSTALAVDFYGDLIPGRTYWILLLPDPDVNYMYQEGDIHLLKPEAFNGFYNDPCAIKADFHVTGNTTIKIDGEIVTPETEFCKGHVNNFTVELQVPRGDGDGEMVTVPADAVYFDWFFGKNREGQIADPQAQYVEINEIYDVSLQDALTIFRNLAPSATELDSNLIGQTDENNNTFTQNMYNLIDYYLNTAQAPEGAQNRPLVLHQPSLNITLLDVMRVVICPIPMSVSEEVMEDLGYNQESWKGNLCWGYTYLELTTTGDAPGLHIGFNTVQYPDDLADKQALRIGLKQIESVSTTSGNNLTVDLRGAQSYDSKNTRFLLQPVTKYNGVIDDSYNKLFLTDTDDPEMKKFITDQGESFDKMSLPIGELKSLEAHYYTTGSNFTNEMQVRFNLETQVLLVNGKSVDFQFKPREGYYYTFTVYFEEAINDVGERTACLGQFPVTMKVVPEYLVWNDTQKTEDYSTIGNWNYDGNWKRATNEDIKATNTIEEYNNDDRGFVPMLFSKVIMPKDSKVELYAAGYNADGSWGYGTGVTARPPHIAAPTDNIQYDLMAFDNTNGLTTERYRVSLLDEIHFEPGAEMKHAEYLIHNKAYVDYKVSPGKWYSWATPIDGVVAGDFYTDDDGNEKQEYFTDINFDSDSNNRFKPSVYQRMWKGKTTEVPLYTDATTKKNVAISGNWSALTNDVAENYEPGKGFSLKVQDVTNEAIFRLPKADTKYDLYHYNNGQPSVGSEITITRSTGSTTKGNLVARQLYNRNTDIDKAGEGEPIEITLSETAHGDYYLVGNPFMAHLDMTTFFEKHTFNSIQINNGEVLEWKYWYLDDDGTQVAVSYDEESNVWTSTKTGDDFLIPPLRSFFVEKKAEGNVIKFTQEMQTLDGNGDGLRSANALTITATTSDGRTSRAAVAYDMAASADYETSEDAELFLDSNLGDVPMVYTVAGTMATSINRTSELYNIPLGVYGSKQEMVTLSFGGLNQFSSATLYDAQEQTETPLHEGKTVSVPSGTSGRYFLRAGTPTGNEVIARNAFLVYSVGGGKVMVTSSNTPLKDIRVYTMGGAQVRSIQASGMQQEIYLNRGIYLITVSDQDGLQETRKVLVR